MLLSVGKDFMEAKILLASNVNTLVMSVFISLLYVLNAIVNMRNHMLILLHWHATQNALQALTLTNNNLSVLSANLHATLVNLKTSVSLVTYQINSTLK